MKTISPRPFSVRRSVRRAFAEFLTLPTVIVVAFLLLAVGAHMLDLGAFAGLPAMRAFLMNHLFADTAAARGFLATTAGGLITVTSITFSLLLLAVQQSATSLTNQVFDQFLRRRLNQVYFGFFVGLALYTLIILSTVHNSFVPIYGATCALILTVAALYLLIVLIHSTINQMRPAVIIDAIHDRTLAARERQMGLLRATRRSARPNGGGRASVRATVDGFITGVDIHTLGAVIGATHAEVELVLRVPIGAFVVLGEEIATVSACPTGARPEDQADKDVAVLARAIRDAIHIEPQRDLDTDPAFGVEELATIGWTSISTAKSNPAPGILAIRHLRDILARWSMGPEGSEAAGDAQSFPIVYPDNVLAELLDAFESLAVVSSESMQHQSLAAVLRTFALLFDRLPPDARRRVEDMLLRVLSTLGDHVLTADLDAALHELVAALSAAGRCDTAAAIEAARGALAASIGGLHARSTRATAGG